jgi:hypothetical protein
MDTQTGHQWMSLEILGYGWMKQSRQVTTTRPIGTRLYILARLCVIAVRAWHGGDVWGLSPIGMSGRLQEGPANPLSVNASLGK